MAPGCKPNWLSSQPPFCFGYIRRQHFIVKARLIGNHSEPKWCHYPKPITLCNQYLLHDDKLKQ